MSQRLAFLQGEIEAAAKELVARGMIGVSAQLLLPGAMEPLLIAAGSRDLGKSAALTGRERFPIASQSKVFTAAAILLLAKEGRIALADPVARYVPGVPAVDADATIDHFLNHTSGIGNFVHAMTVLPHPWPRFSYDELMSLARMQGRQFSAGARLDYNNTDVVVLARLCELVLKKPMSEILRERIFEPLGMQDTCLAMGDIWPRHEMAKGYYVPSQSYDGPPIDVSTLSDYSIASAAGNIVSTQQDMARWLRALQSPSNAVGLKLEDFVANVADHGDALGHWFFPRTYGRGMESWHWGGRAAWGHRGSFFGYHSGSFIEPRSGAAFTMFLTMTTSGSFMRFIDVQGHDYMAFMQACCQGAVAAVANTQ